MTAPQVLNIHGESRWVLTECAHQIACSSDGATLAVVAGGWMQGIAPHGSFRHPANAVALRSANCWHVYETHTRREAFPGNVTGYTRYGRLLTFIDGQVVSAHDIPGGILFGGDRPHLLLPSTGLMRVNTDGSVESLWDEGRHLGHDLPCMSPNGVWMAMRSARTKALRIVAVADGSPRFAAKIPAVVRHLCWTSDDVVWAGLSKGLFGFDAVTRTVRFRRTQPTPITATFSCVRSNAQLRKSGCPLYQPTKAVAEWLPSRSSPGMFIWRSVADPTA